MTFFNGLTFFICFIAGVLLCYFAMVGEYAIAALVCSWLIFILVLYAIYNRS